MPKPYQLLHIDSSITRHRRPSIPATLHQRIRNTPHASDIVRCRRRLRHHAVDIMRGVTPIPDGAGAAGRGKPGPFVCDLRSFVGNLLAHGVSSGKAILDVEHDGDVLGPAFYAPDLSLTTGRGHCFACVPLAGHGRGWAACVSGVESFCEEGIGEMG